MPMTCSLCCRAPRRRRQLCWSCYRKLRDAGVTLPDRMLVGKGSLVVLVIAICRAFTTPERAEVRKALDGAA